MTPLISVIVNCHNGEKYLEKCILSIINQKYQNLEIIFFDNFSSDKSKAIIKKFNDERIKYFYSDIKLSLYKARNEAIKKTSGSLIAFLDVDDWWDKNYLSTKEIYFVNKKYDYFYSNVLKYFEKKNYYNKYKKFNFPEGVIYKFLAKDYFIIISGLIIRKEILEKENYFNENYNIIGDYDLIMKISKYAIAKGFNESLVTYRVHEKNFSKLNQKMYFEEYKDWFEKQSLQYDENFQEHKRYFLCNLMKLEIIYLLYQRKTLSLLTKIIRIPNFLLKLKFLLAFFVPSKFINFFRK